MRAVLVCLAILLFFSACSPLYVIEAAYHESGILLRRRDISEVLADRDSSDKEREKLSIVRDAREFGISIGLTPGQSFTKYSRVSRDVLAWVLMGSRPDAFELYSWWFPIVGSVPYKGYFEKADAECAGRRLEFEGYETFVRGTDAFSTLGWFNDPVLSTTLRRDNIRIANTVLHESLHSTVWIPGQVPFNESLANFVGAEAALEFFTKRCQAGCTEAQRAELKNAEIDKARELELAVLVTNLYEALDTLYRSDKSRAEKISKRSEIFDQVLAPLRAKYPNLSILKTINNAEIMQLKIYLTQLEKFELLFKKRNMDWKAFLADLQKIRETVTADNKQDAFHLLTGLL
ncbi:MAG: aminopeptidase [Oligoflexia bacterium]|nr:aminopeptidase [Oligoflexia bacterium]